MTPLGALFLIGPLLVVPLGLRLVDRRGERAHRLGALAIAGSLPAAIVLSIGMAIPPGPIAALAAAPWLLVTLTHAAASMVTFAEPMRRTGGRTAMWRAIRTDPAWIDAVGAGFLVIGSGWILADRLGFAPFGFDPIVVRLTAVHFHFAGFTLLLVAGRLTRAVEGTLPWSAATLVALGVPTVALGFFGLTFVGLVGILAVTSGGLLVGALHLVASGRMTRSDARWLARVAGISLFVTMPLAILWGIGTVVPLGWLDVSTMIRIHGTLNVIGFAVPAVVAWTLESASGVAVQRARLATR
jgi:YndJ-like protein